MVYRVNSDGNVEAISKGFGMIYFEDETTVETVLELFSDHDKFWVTPAFTEEDSETSEEGNDSADEPGTFWELSDDDDSDEADGAWG